jgi:TIR domain/NACHT domain
MPEKKTFFISRAGADKRWAELIASVVRDAGHEPFFEDEHFPPGQSIPDNMARGAEADCTIAVFSPAYFESEFCLAELNAALMKDPLGRQGYLIPVRVAPVEIPSLVAQLAYLDLVGTTDETARQRLTATLRKHGQIDLTKFPLIGRTRRAVEQANRNRTAMIEKVRTIWITGFLQQSLFRELRIVMGLNERPGAVARPMDLLVKRPDEGERPLPSGTPVIDVFDEMGQSLLILGAPGSGKTTLLLEVARDLLDRADRDPGHPIPVVFPLSTWAESRMPLHEWLKNELNLRYDVPRKIAKEWVESDQILPMLDGLDEVKAEHRAACVDALNVFRQSHGFLPLAITSRTADYESLAEPLRLHGGIVVRPLTREQIDTYLADLGFAGQAVRAAIQDDSSLRELLVSPLMLNIVTASYAGRTTEPVPSLGTAVDRRNQLFGSYVNQMLRRRAAEKRYTPEQLVRWLRWLADRMANHSKTVFYLEQLQPDWLPHRQRRAISLCWRAVVGLGSGLVIWLWAGLAGGVGYGLALGMGAALLLVPFFGLATFLGEDIRCVDIVGWSWSKARGVISSILASRLVVGLFLAVVVIGSCTLVGWMLFGNVDKSAVILLVECVVGLIIVLLMAPLVGLAFGLVFEDIEIRALPNAGIRRSARNAFTIGLIVGLIVGLGVGLFLGLFDLIAGLFLGLAFGLGAGLVVGWNAGGGACLKHFVLRFWLILNGSTPWNYVKFLDYAADRILLRKVGGGYMFIHRMLLEWFAARYVEPGTMPKRDPSSGEHQSA